MRSRSTGSWAWRTAPRTCSGALRDGRFAVRRDIVDLLLVTAEGISRSMPGAEKPVGAAEIDELVAALDRALAGEDPVEVPKLGRAATLADAPRRRRRRRASAAR